MICIKIHLEHILKILKPKALDRVKVNCLPRSNEIIISGLHTDLDETDIPWKTALLYVNTNNLRALNLYLGFDFKILNIFSNQFYMELKLN